MTPLGLQPRPLTESRPLFREFINIAHRGACAVAPEHTIASYDLALHMGAQFIELDVRLTRDGMPVIFHDANLARIHPRHSGWIGSKTLAELKSYDLRVWFKQRYAPLHPISHAGLRILSLQEALERYRHCVRFCIELKDPALYAGIEAKVLALIHHYDLHRSLNGVPLAVIQSFDANCLRKLRGLDDGLPLLQLLPERTGHEALTRVAEIRTHAKGICTSRHVATRALLNKARKAQLALIPFTVNDIREMRRLMDLGVDGMVTDHPELLYRLVRERALERDPESP